MATGSCFSDAALFLKNFQVVFLINGFWLKVVLITRTITAYVCVWSDHLVSAQENLPHCLLPKTLSGQNKVECATQMIMEVIWSWRNSWAAYDFMWYCGMGIRKESETCEGTLSHFGLKPGSEIVNEKNLRHHPAGFHKVKAPGVKASKINVINNSNATEVQEQ